MLPNETEMEAQASFFERQLNSRTKVGGPISTSMIFGSLIVLLIRAVLANTAELRKLNSYNAVDKPARFG